MICRPRIILDVDGPLTNGVCEFACTALREMGYKDARPDMVTHWGITESFYNVTLGDTQKMWERMRLPGVASGFAPREGALVFVDGLRAWADVVAVTAPLDHSPTWAHDREKWLVEHLGFTKHEIVSVRDKALVPGDVIVDDLHTTLKRWRSVHPDKLTIMWDMPYNRTEQWAGPVASDFEELTNHLDTLRK